MAVTPDNRKDPINVDDGDNSIIKSIISLIDDNMEGGGVGDDVMDGSGLTIVLTSSTYTDNVTTVGGAPSVNFSSTDGTGNNDTGNNNTGNHDTGDVSMGGVNSKHNVGKEGAADSNLIAQLEREISDFLYLIGTSTGHTRGTEPEDLLSEGSLKIANAELLRLQRSLEKKDCNL